jgi:hypothetical protein
MSNFGNALIILWQGMLGIFVFMSVFYGVIYALEKLFQPRQKP